MSREESNITAGAQADEGHMTREEVVAFFERRQVALDNLDAATLASDYADDCVVDSPTGGTHTGRASVQSVFEAVFEAFLDQKTRTDHLIIDGDHVAQVLSIEGTNIGRIPGFGSQWKAVPSRRRICVRAQRSSNRAGAPHL